MIEKLKRTILGTISDNLKGYILVILIFIAGAFLALLMNISSASLAEMRLYVRDFISNVKNYSTDSLQTFLIAVKGYAVFLSIVFLLSLTVIGSVAIMGYIFVKGFSYGIFISVLLDVFGARWVLFFMCSVLPHIIIIVPCTVSYLLYCIKNAHGISKGVKELKQNTLAPFLYGILCFVLCTAGALIQAYLEPLLIRCVSF